jgi:Type II secretion system (T2SS), protein E, N-terminal domain
MARAEAPRERIGDMLLGLGLINRTQLDEALVSQQTTKLPLGKQLVALGSVSEVRLTQVLSNQLSVPWVSLERVEFPADLLARMSGEIADRHSVLPIYVRNVRGRGATLYVAMDDPTDEDVLRTIADAASMPVRPMIAPPSEIRRAIEQRYFGAQPAPVDESTGLRNVPPRGAKQFSPANDNKSADKTTEAIAKTGLTGKQKKPPPPPGPTSATRPDALVAVEQYEAPSQPPPAGGGGQRTLTLLDGTQVKLPSARKAAPSQDVRAVRHIVKAIRAARAELQSEDPLRWHDMIQAVLEALEIRGVRLTRKEIADAWLANRQKREQPKAQ